MLTIYYRSVKNILKTVVAMGKKNKRECRPGYDYFI